MKISPIYRKLAWFLDECFKIPGTKIRFGLDAIVGLIPGFGDIVMALSSILVMGAALQARVSAAVLMRMLLNIGIELGVGAIPLVGDIFDIFWKANQKNIKLIDDFNASPQRLHHESLLILVSVFVVVVGLILLLMSGIVWLTYKVWVAL